ncbi:MAG: acyltransferase [Lachnospiraceae bacterium]|nr:acyltransferase [Lachnospiraceae bacterium]
MRQSYYFKSLTGLRAILCLIIVCYHYYGINNGMFFFSISFLNKMIENGNFAVDFFFMISGFCLAANYKNKIQNDGVSFRKYFVNHYVKFVNFTLITLPIAIIKQVLVSKAGLDATPSFENALYDVLCLRTGWGIKFDFPYNSPLWFIDVLLIMYIIYFFICKNSNDKRDQYIVCCIGIVLVGLTLLLNNVSWFIFEEITARGYCNFFGGCLLFELYSIADQNSEIKKKSSICFAILVFVFFSIFVLEDTRFIGNIRTMCMFVMWPAIIWGCVNISIVERILSVNIFQRLGKISNSIFIWHHPILYIIYALKFMEKIQIEFNNIVVFLIIIIAIGLVALFSNKYIEKIIPKFLLKMNEIQKGVNGETK